MSSNTHKNNVVDGPRKILAFVELSDGVLDDFGKGLLTEAGRLARELSGTWCVAAFGTVADETIMLFSQYGVDRVLMLDCDTRVLDCPELQAQCLAQAAEREGADVVLLAHNDLGNTLAPMVTHALDAALMCECIAYTASDDDLLLSRRVLGAQVAESKRWDGGSRLVVTINRQILSTVVLPSVKPGTADVETWKPAVSVKDAQAKIIERIPADPKTVDLVDAEVIFSAGLGCSEASMELVRELTHLLNASVGVTRPAYDLGYADFSRMVGQTGKTVTPRFYLALGISGSMHHIGGIKDSKRVVSVNIDPKAPIIPNSDEAFVADLNDLLPVLVERVKATVGGA